MKVSSQFEVLIVSQFDWVFHNLSFEFSHNWGLFTIWIWGFSKKKSILVKKKVLWKSSSCENFFFTEKKLFGKKKNGEKSKISKIKVLVDKDFGVKKF